MRLPKAERDWKAIKLQPTGLTKEELHKYSNSKEQ